MPISAPMPNSPPSANCVEALCIKIALSNRWKKRSTARASSAKMQSVWLEPYWRICAMASSTFATVFAAISISKNSLPQWSAPAGCVPAIACKVTSASTTTPLSIKAWMTSGPQLAAISSCISKHSAAPQIPVRRVLAFSTTSKVFCRSAEASM